jgi:NAD(P)-dependent dehydrogenase (short-subunit alcohol dehydrogenase family)
MLLQNKVAVIYGAGGAIGGAVARAFAAEGAKVYVTGRGRAAVDVVAKEITAAGGFAHAAEVDALDEHAIRGHLESVMGAEGSVDVSFNAIGVPDEEVVGVPLAELDVAKFSHVIASYTRSYFLTAQHAARHMIPAGSGVIMTVSALPARTGSRLNGGYGAANAAKEALTRDLSAELAPRGIRVVGLCPHGMPETATMRELAELKADATGVNWDKFQGYLAASTHPQRAMRLSELADAAVYAASDRASALTGTTINLTMGTLGG